MALGTHAFAIATGHIVTSKQFAALNPFEIPAIASTEECWMTIDAASVFKNYQFAETTTNYDSHSGSGSSDSSCVASSSFAGNGCSRGNDSTINWCFSISACDWAMVIVPSFLNP